MIVNGSATYTNEAVQKLLGSVHGLSNGPHTAVFTNTGSGTPIDIDWMQFETQIGSTGSVLFGVCSIYVFLTLTNAGPLCRHLTATTLTRVWCTDQQLEIGVPILDLALVGAPSSKSR